MDSAVQGRRWRVTIAPETEVEGFAPLEIAVTLPEGVGEDSFAWWVETAVSDFAEMSPKMEEYGGRSEGSADLRLGGDMLGELLGWDAPSAVRQELSVWFYAMMKMARLVSDYQVQRPGKADTWHDATVYSMMARRLQAVGRWP